MTAGRVGLIAAVAVLLTATAGQATAAAPEAVRTQFVGPGGINAAVRARPLTLRLSIHPNRAGAWNRTVLTVRRNGRPIRHAAVTVRFTMLSMSMGSITFRLSAQRSGEYVYDGPATVMPGAWKLSFHIKPQTGTPVTASLEDHVN